MKLAPFLLEQYFAQWEFKAPYLLSSSDVDSMSMRELLNLADAETLAMWENLSLGYTECTGLPQLKEEIAEHYVSASPGDLSCFTGAEEGIQCAMQALVSPGDHVVVITPCYQSLESLPRALGADVTTVALSPEMGWELDLEAFEASLRPNTRLIAINYPHNPTGALLSQTQLDKIVELARERGTYIFSDEVYRGLEQNEADRLTPVADLYERGLSLGVLSKAYGLPGLRVGWLVCRDAALMADIGNAKHYSSICNGAPSEVLALIAMRSHNEILDRGRKIVADNYALMESCFLRYPELLTWIAPKGGCIAFPKFNLDIDADKFARDLVEKEGVLLLPASIYQYEGKHLRIGFGRRNMPEALERFERYLQNLKAI